MLFSDSFKNNIYYQNYAIFVIPEFEEEIIKDRNYIAIKINIY